MKNVIIFAVATRRYALELRWVTEVVSLGFVTPVPGAPPAFAGVTSLHGVITPVLRLGVLLGDDDIEDRHAQSTPRGAGDSAILLQVEAVAAALLISKVDEVATLRDVQPGRELRDSTGRSLRMLDPPSLISRALAAVHESAGRMGALRGVG